MSSETQNKIINHLKKGNPVIVLVHGYVKLVDGKTSHKAYDSHYITLLGINEKNEIMVGDPGNSHVDGYTTINLLSNTSNADCYFLVSK